MLDLVNENYQDFLSLGSSLQGGDEKVEEVRLGLLGFRRDVETIKGKVDERKREVEDLVEERRHVRNEIEIGRALLEVNRRLQELEQRLMIISDAANENLNGGSGAYDPSESEEESDDEHRSGMSTSRLRRHAQSYLCIKKAIAHIGPEHPFLVNQEERVLRLKQTILLDLGSALKQTKNDEEQGQERLLRLLAVYEEMGEYSEASKVLKERGS